MKKNEYNEKKMLPAENFNAIPHTCFPEVTVEAFVGFYFNFCP